MSPQHPRDSTGRQQLDLALKKQRLLMRSSALRENFGQYANTWKPVFAAADRLRNGLRWLRRHPALPVASLVALAVARPWGMLRWARRGWFAWQALRNLRIALLAKQTRSGGR